jgi:acyl carrier protein
MGGEQLRSKIEKILADILPEIDYSESTDFVSEGLLDSFDIITLVTELDETFNVSIEGKDIVAANFSSIDKIFHLLKKYV